MFSFKFYPLLPPLNHCFLSNNPNITEEIEHNLSRAYKEFHFQTRNYNADIMATQQ